MSVIGEIASIAGVVSLAAQTIQAASTIYSLLKAYKRIHPRVSEIQTDVSNLRQTLQGVATLNIKSCDSTTAHLSNLHASVLRCHPVLGDLEAQIRCLEATSTGFFRRVVRKAKIAADVEYFSTISRQIHLCRADVSLHLELLQSATSLVICEQLNTVNLGLDTIRGRQADTLNTLLSTRCDVRADIADARSEQRLALSSLACKIDQAMRKPPSCPAMASADLASVDARLKLLESRLVESMQPSKTTSELAIYQSIGKEAKVQEVMMRLIKPGILKYEDNGVIVSELLPIEDRKALQLDTKARLILIRHVQGLRILLWLLRQDNYLSSVSMDIGTMHHCSLVRQARVTSLWEFCSSYTELREAQAKLQREASKLSLFKITSVVRWISCAHWVYYVFQRIDGREGYQNVMRSPASQLRGFLRLRTLRLSVRFLGSSAKMPKVYELS